MIKTLHTENFRMLSGERDFEFPEGIVGIVGPNGQGKSTLINSIAWAMYGPEALPLKARDPITWDAKEALVRVEFGLNDGTDWTVERLQKPTGLGKAKLYNDHGNKADGSAPTTNAITELMGVDREGFMISVFARQNELDRLRSMEAAPRMQTVLRLLRINQITKAVKIVREDGNEQKKALDVLRGHQIDAEAIQTELGSLSAELSNVMREAIAAQAEVVDLNAAIVQLRSERQANEPKRKAYFDYLNELQSRKTTLMLAETTLRQAQVVQAEPEKPKEPEYYKLIGTTQDEVDLKKATYLELRDGYTSLKSEYDPLSAQVLDMKDTCPTCGRPFDDAAHIEREKKKIQNRIAQLTEAIRSISLLGTGAKEEWENSATRQRTDNESNQNNARLEADFRAAVRQYELAMAHRAEAQGRVTRAESDLKAAQKALAALVPVQDAQDEESRISAALDIRQLSLNEWTQRLTSAQGDQRTLEIEIERLRDVLKDAANASISAKKIEKEVTSYETTAEELQRLKETMIGRIIPALNERASALVEVMTDGKYSELSLTPDYEIEYRNPLGDYKNFLNLSGGEQTVFALALRLAISDLQAGNLGVLFLDEAISNLSSEDGRQESVWQAIESLTGRFRQVFVITHVEAFKDRAPFVVRL